MQHELFFTELRQLIADNELAIALSQLQTFLKDSPKLDETIVQSARHRDILRQIRIGTINEHQANLTKNQIRAGLLDFIRELENRQEIESHYKRDYEYIVKKIKDNRDASTSELLNHKTINDLEEKELIWLFEQERVLQFFENTNTALQGLTNHEKLRHLSLAENGHIFKGTFLCLGQRHQIFSVCHTAIEAKFIQFKGTGKEFILVLDSLHGNLLRQYEKMMLLLRTYIPLGRDRANSADIYEIPIIAVREFIVNAFIHRSYENDVRSYIQVELYDDRLEIKSPGQLPENVNVRHIEGTVLVNPVIAAIFYLYKHIERAGTGIQIAQVALKNHGLKPARIENIQSPQMVKVTIFRNRYVPNLDKSKGFFGRLLDGFRHVFS